MPKLNNRFPSYRLHKASGQAVVTLNGRDIYLGIHNTDESRDRYKVVIQEWLACQKQLPPNGPTGTPPRIPLDITINEVFLPYWEHAQTYYVKNGKQTREVANIKAALTPLLQTYGTYPAKDFGPLALKTYREMLVEGGFSRQVINKKLSRVKQFFKWGVANEMISAEIFHALQTVPGLKRGRTAAPESKPVKPVPMELVEATLKHANRYVAAMIRLQLYTGMRPAEVTIMRRCDIDQSGNIWKYIPYTHKTEHHGRERVIFLGPQAQKTLIPFLNVEPEAYLFSPRKAKEEMYAQRRANATTKRYTPYKRKHRPQKQPGEHYTTDTYENAIHRGTDKAFPPPEGLNKDELKDWRKKYRWAPNRLRHTAATFLRKEFGIDAARVILGHSSPTVTEVYAELDYEKAADIMSQVG
ncbi:MAG: tyrosine-type recombinase/integrase [Phycisphaerae bacterium]|nr:tyrosine-type recombinase/integrase [Phycisphaerae bacterium]